MARITRAISAKTGVIMSIIFVADPMCSWCYGFAKELDEARHIKPQISVDIKVAGLWAGNRQLLTEEQKQFRLMHWEKVEKASGATFNKPAFLARHNFYYDTENISKAFVAGKYFFRDIDQLSLLRALQKSFYIDGDDTTDTKSLAKTLSIEFNRQGHSVDFEFALNLIESDSIYRLTLEEFQYARGFNFSSVPKLLHAHKGEVKVILDGFAKSEAIIKALEDLI